MLHIPGFGYDGVTGYSPITLAREAIGLGMAADEFGARYFGSGTHPGRFSTPRKLPKSKAEPKTLDAALKSHRMMLFEDGSQEHCNQSDRLTIFETRKFQINEICRLFHVPPHMLADVEKSTSWGSGIKSRIFSHYAALVRFMGRGIECLLDSEKDEYNLTCSGDS